MKENGRIYALCLGLVVLAIVAVSYLVLRQPADKPTTPADKTVVTAEDGRKHLCALALMSKEWTGDFDKMLEFRRIRVLVPPSRTLSGRAARSLKLKYGTSPGTILRSRASWRADWPNAIRASNR